MTVLLRPRQPRWVWPVSMAGAALALLLLSMVPSAWWRLLMPARMPHRSDEREIVADLRVVELVFVRPPPIISVLPPDQPPIEPDVSALDSDWWQRAWHGRIASDLLMDATALPESLWSPVLAVLLDSRAELELILAAPDSVLEARLWRLALSQKLGRNDLDGFFRAVARARSFADLKSREAAMYGDFLQETVPVPK